MKGRKLLKTIFPLSKIKGDTIYMTTEDYNKYPNLVRKANKVYKYKIQLILWH